MLKNFIRKLIIQDKKLADAFGEVLSQAYDSTLYTEMCMEVFGTTFSQYNMVDFDQLDFLVKEIGSQKNILDFGCGYGTVSEYIANITDSSLVGIDFSDKLIEIAKSRGDQNYLVANLNEFTPADKYDAIIFLDSFYSIPNPKKFIKKLKDHLNKGGKIIIMRTTVDNDSTHQVLNKLAAKVIDFSNNEQKIWESMINFINHHADEILMDGKPMLWNTKSQEVNKHLELINKNKLARFSYIIQKE